MRRTGFGFGSGSGSGSGYNWRLASTHHHRHCRQRFERWAEHLGRADVGGGTTIQIDLAPMQTLCKRTYGEVFDMNGR